MNILDEIVQALQVEERIMLATIIATSGSTPAPAFSKMLVNNNGVTAVGTVGGGCMEGDVVLHANRLLQTGKAEILTVHLNEDDIERGLICGGTVDILIEPATKNDISFYEKLRLLFNDGEDCVLVTEIDASGSVKRKSIIPSSSRLQPVHSIQETSLLEIAKNVHKRKLTMRLTENGNQIILEPFTASPRLIIFGGGHVGFHLCRVASMAGFEVTVADDREKYANRSRFPDAENVVVTDFQNAFENIAVSDSSYIAIVTRGHHQDEAVLKQALKTSARYIGMIGSKRKAVTIFQHLLAKGVSMESLRPVHTPMGIEIGALTAEEIAVSIVAQLINVRRDGALTIHYKSDETKILLHALEPKSLIAEQQ
jgi:xanthine dehydrogenase accessory factor